MKKIFRMALVFALAGAALMYTGCSKDYGEEIDKLDGKLSTLQSDLSSKLQDLEGRLSTLSSGVSGLESTINALKGVDDGFKGDISGLKSKVGEIEDAIKDLDKLAKKSELTDATAALEKKIDDGLAALKDSILVKAEDLQGQIDALKAALDLKADAASVFTKDEVNELLAKYYTAEEVDALLAKLAQKEDVEGKIADAQKNLDDVFALLSDELRSIVFLPDFYLAGIEATSYDFASFVGYVFYGNGMSNVVFYAKDFISGLADDENVKYTIPKNVKYLADYNYETDSKGKPVYYKYDTETYDWVLDKNGKMVKGKEGDEDVRMYFPDNHLQGQDGTARYTLNPSSFPVDSAEWSMNGRNLKYVLKAEEEDTWSAVVKSITKDASSGIANVAFEIINPERMFCSVIGAAFTFVRPKDLLQNEKSGTHYNWMERAQNELLAEEFGYNNVPTVQLVGTLSDGREIVSDWHAISSSEELVDHLAFDNSNPYVTDWGDCGLDKTDKDLYTDSQWCIVDPYSVPVKYNGGPVDLDELLSIHTSSWLYEGYSPLAAYTLDEFNAKYPGHHFEYSLLTYYIGGNNTSEDMYGKIDGSKFTPCLVKSEGGKAQSIPIEKDSEDGISSVGRMPVVFVTLVEDATKAVHAYGWFKIIISKDARLPQFFEIPDLPKVPFICANFTLSTKWHEFNYFVLENLKVDYEQFMSYKYDGVWVYANVLDEKTGKVSNELIKVEGSDVEGSYKDLKFKNYDTSKKEYKTLNYGQARYAKDSSGSGINDAFAWKVSPQGIGAGKTNSIYFKFTRGDEEVYFQMKAVVAPKAKMGFVANKLASVWFSDITDPIEYNTARISVPVPEVPVPDVMDFFKDINELFQGNKPELYLKEDSDPVYASYWNNWMDGTGTYTALHKHNVAFQFSATQPVITDNEGLTWPLFVKTWKGGTSEKADYMHLYVQTYYYFMNMRLPDQDELDDADYTKVPKIWADGSNLLATITANSDGSYVIEYADTDIAKKLLNLWSYKVTDEKQMLYANIVAKDSYDTCKITVDDGNFHIRFIRPIDVDFAAQDVAEESQIDGANVEVVKFISGITDWNNYKVLVKEMEDVLDADGNPVKDENGKVKQEWTGYYIPNVYKTVDLYEYYGFETLRIDLDGTMRNNVDLSNRSKFYKISEKVPSARIALGNVDTDGVFSPLAESGIVEVDITNFEDLKEYMINYKNGQAYQDAFTVIVPVEIDYAWGTISDWMVINVKTTGETSGE